VREGILVSHQSSAIGRFFQTFAICSRASSSSMSLSLCLCDHRTAASVSDRTPSSRGRGRESQANGRRGEREEEEEEVVAKCVADADLESWACGGGIYFFGRHDLLGLVLDLMR
jgi:hypothetical protein